MLAHRVHENPYEQMVGSTERLKELPAQSFDVVVCHNVLEYVTDREEVLCEFCRVLKPDGFLSVIKHNKAGKIMQKAVFEYITPAVKYRSFYLSEFPSAALDFLVVATTTPSKIRLADENLFCVKFSDI